MGEDKKNSDLRAQLSLMRELLPHEFSFERQSPIEWIEEAKEIAKDIGLGDKMLMKILVAKLPAEAAQDARAVGCFASGETMDTFAGKILEILCPDTLRDRARQDLRRRSRNPGESALEFLRALKIEGSKAYSNRERRIEEIRTRFVEGQGKSLEAELLRNKKASLEEMLTMIHDFERLWGTSEDIGKMSIATAEHAPEKRVSEELAPLKQQFRRNIRSQPNGNKRWNGPANFGQSQVKCYRCNTTGHIARECSLRQNIECRKCHKTGHIARACRQTAQTLNE